jgi:hypothetical protein
MEDTEGDAQPDRRDERHLATYLAVALPAVVAWGASLPWARNSSCSTGCTATAGGWATLVFALSILTATVAVVALATGTPLRVGLLEIGSLSMVVASLTATGAAIAHSASEFGGSNTPGPGAGVCVLASIAMLLATEVAIRRRGDRLR